MLRLCLSMLLLTGLGMAQAGEGFACRTDPATKASACWSMQDGTVRGVPRHGRAFIMRLAGEDPIGSVEQCMERLHRRQWRRLGKHGAGVCYIQPGALHAGRHNSLVARYPDVKVGLEP